MQSKCRSQTSAEGNALEGNSKETFPILSVKYGIVEEVALNFILREFRGGVLGYLTIETYGD